MLLASHALGSTALAGLIGRRALHSWSTVGIYRAQFSQAVHDNPIVIELENQFGDIYWSRGKSGVYYGHGEFAGVALLEIGANDYDGELRIDQLSDSLIRVMHWDNAMTLADDVPACAIHLRRYE